MGDAAGGDELLPERFGCRKPAQPDVGHQQIRQQLWAGRRGSSERSGPLQQVRGHRGLQLEALPGRLVQPTDRLRIARSGSPSDVGGDLHGTPTGGPQNARRMRMKLLAHGHRQVSVDRISDQVVAESQPIVQVHQEVGTPSLVKWGHQVGRWAPNTSARSATENAEPSTEASLRTWMASFERNRRRRKMASANVGGTTPPHASSPGHPPPSWTAETSSVTI